MKLLVILVLALITNKTLAQSAGDRIVHNDPSKYKVLSNVHAGAGTMGFTQLIGRSDLATNFLYLHTGVINPRSGIGHHFHHNIEEMYVLLNGEAEFTINGRTSKIKSPAVVPCKLGDSHAIHNPSGEPIRWMNFAVSNTKGRGDAFDLADSRVGAKLDPIPNFVSSRLERNRLKPGEQEYAKDILHRRVFGPDIFRTNWAYVDHVVLPVGASTGNRQPDGIEEVFYVMKGDGSVTLGNDKSGIKADDVFFSSFEEAITLSNEGNSELELLVVGIAVSKQNGVIGGNALVAPVATVLQMDFVVEKANAKAFEKMYHSIYVPAMKVQQGYLGSKLLRLYGTDLSKEIEAESTTYNYQIQISFDTEANRRKWVASSQHQIAWPAAASLVKEYKWRGYDVMGDDDQR